MISHVNLYGLYIEVEIVRGYRGDYDGELHGSSPPESDDVLILGACIDDDAEWDDWLHKTSYCGVNPDPLDWIEWTGREAEVIDEARRVLS